MTKSRVKIGDRIRVFDPVDGGTYTATVLEIQLYLGNPLGELEFKCQFKNGSVEWVRESNYEGHTQEGGN